MKTLLLFLFIGLFSVSVVHAQEAKVTMNIKNKPINDVFTEIKSQTPYSFWFDANDLDVNKRVTIEVKDQTVKSVLTRILSGQSVEFKMNGNHIVITKKKPEEKKEQPERPKADDIVIKMTVLTGEVKDINGEPLPGVSVFLKGSLFGAMTDMDGKYSLKLPESTSNTSKISFLLLGMKTQEINYEKKSVIDMVMEEDSQKLTDVVVTGYQNVDRRDMVGSYTTIKAEDIMMPAYSSIDEMLQGQVAGMIVTNSSARLGASPNITIRGTATLLGNTSPLWVVDGVIQHETASLNGSSSLFSGSSSDSPWRMNEYLGNQISWLNPNDIETITVLKDASATAIYGSKASNGVIVITTKKGGGDRISVNYSANVSVSMAPTYDNYYLMNSKERINFSKEAFDAGVKYSAIPIKQPYTYEGLTRMYLEGDISENEYIQQYNYLETVNTDWFDLLLRDAVGHSHNLSINGSSKRTTYTASVAYNSRQGIEKGNDSERFSGRLRIGFEVSPTINIDVSLAGTVEKTDAFTGAANPESYAVNTSRAIPSHHPNGDLLFYKTTGKYNLNSATENNLTYNILNELDNSYSRVKTPQIDATMNFQWQIIPELKYEFVAGYKNSNRTTEAFAGENSRYVIQNYRGYEAGTVLPSDPEFKAAQLPFGGVLNTDGSQRESYNIQNKVVFSKTINRDHRLNGMAAWEVSSVKYLAKFNTVWGYMPERGESVAMPTPLDELEPIDGTKPSNWGILNDLYTGSWRSTNQTNNAVSAFATFAYSYKNRYVLNANFRNDASNRFGQDTNKRFDPTLSIGVAWSATEEEFMKQTQDWLSDLKLRFTYGSQGNVLTNEGPEMILLQSRISTLYGEYYSRLSRLGNPLLEWERTNTWNVGLDVGFLKNKITGTFEYYGRKSNPITKNYPTPETGTTNSIPVVGTHIDNHGVEATIDFKAIDKKDWTFTASINLSKNWNTVTKIVDNKTRSIKASTYIGGQSKDLLEIDYPIGAFWAYSFAGLDASGYPTFNYLDGSNGTHYTDFLKYAGNVNPDVSGGINLYFRYKKVALSSQFAAVVGNKKFLNSPYASFLGSGFFIPTPYNNVSKELTERWRKPGDERYTDIPALYTGLSTDLLIKNPKDNDGVNKYEMWAKSDARLVDGSFLRCKQISFSWYVDPALLKTVGIRSLTMSATVNNIFVIASSKFNGMDPELGTSTLPKTFSFGLNLGF